MKYLYKYIFVLSLFVFSTATNYCMEENLELKPYEPDTIENIKKQRDIFTKFLIDVDRININFYEMYSILLFRPIYSGSQCCDNTPINGLFKGHSMLSVLIVGPYITQEEKIKRIYQAKHIFISSIKPTPRDLQFARLELYERKHSLKDKIIRLYKVKPHIENMVQEQFPHEIVQHIGMLMLETEKSLL